MAEEDFAVEAVPRRAVRRWFEFRVPSIRVGKGPAAAGTIALVVLLPVATLGIALGAGTAAQANVDPPIATVAYGEVRVNDGPNQALSPNTPSGLPTVKATTPGSATLDRQTTSPTPTSPASTPSSAPKSTPTASSPACKITRIDTGVNSNVEPIIRGTCAANDKVTIKVGAITLTATSDAEGNWSTTGPKTSGDHTVTVSSAKNSTPAHSSYRVEPAPTFNLIEGDDGLVTIEGQASPGRIEILLNGATHDYLDQTQGGLSYDLNLDPGTHTIALRYVDPDGRTGESTTRTITIS
ncbi:MAG: hypothetical protein LBE83_01260 [Propionibacteriaceae bacterium]|jgi:hypothetical protein|nr:hypothetical protein [Propionibacteriaceae bacterium]